MEEGERRVRRVRDFAASSAIASNNVVVCRYRVPTRVLGRAQTRVLRAHYYSPSLTFSYVRPRYKPAKDEQTVSTGAYGAPRGPITL